MAKNDYRRSLIMLRGMERGYSGHARLETRVLSGTLDYTVTAPTPEETLSAALIGPRGGRFTGVDLGRLRDDGRGQKGLLATFDPRNIAGLDLGEVSVTVIVREETGGVTPVMYGWVNGAKALDWNAVRAALDMIYMTGATAESGNTTAFVAENTITEAKNKGLIDAGETTADASSEVQETVDAADTEHAEITQEAVGAACCATGMAEAGDISPNFTAENEATEAGKTETRSQLPAGTYLNIDMSRKWPDDVEDLRILFLTFPRYEPFEMNDFVFVRAAMAEESGIDHCAVGVRAENGSVTGVCYAVPMTYTAEPPAGLEEAVWMGDSNSGWWVTMQDIRETAGN